MGNKVCVRWSLRGSTRSWGQSRAALLLAVAIAVIAASCAPTASASVSKFGGHGPGAGQFEEAHGIAIFQETGDVYMADTFNERLDSFTAEGAFRFAVGWGVRDGKDELEKCTTSCRPGLEGAGAGQFGNPRGVAVDNNPASPSYGDVYVADNENHRVQKFDSSGNFVLTFGKEVNTTTKGDVCTSAESASCGAGLSGFGPGEFSIMAGGIAVGPSGAVYVGDIARVEHFGPEGAFVGEWALGEAVFLVESLAVNSSEEIYVVAENLNGVHRYNEAGVEQGLPFATENFIFALSVGPADEVYVDERFDGVTEQPHLGEYSREGTQLEAFDVGAEGGSRGIAFGNDNERVYVVNHEAVRLVAAPPPGPFTVPGSETLVQAKPSDATLGAVIIAEGSPTTYTFEYGESTAYGSATPSTALPEEGGLFAAQSVQAHITGLKPNTTYHFRTATENAKGEMTFGPDATFTTTVPVLISGEAATQVTPESARLTAELNPQGSAAQYHFEYGLSTSYEHSLPVPDASAGESNSPASHSVIVEGLLPGTAYHYRVVATNSFGTVEGSDHVFETAKPETTALADGRVWEMVSPPNKSGASLEAISEEGGLIQASTDGSAIAYVGKGPLGAEAEPEGSQSISDSQFVAKRSSPGTWATQDITTTHDRPAGFHPGRRAEYLFFSDDLSRALVEPFGETPLSERATERTPYLREVAGGYTPLVTTSNTPEGTKFGGQEVGGGDYVGGAELVGASPDLTDAVITSPLALTEDFATPEGFVPSLYRWDSSSEALQLVSWLPPTTEEPQETPAAATGSSATLGGRNNASRDAVSSNGNRLVYEVTGPSGGIHLFLRDMAMGETVQLDLGEGGVSGRGHARFQDASTDGRVIYFTDEERLTADATAEVNGSFADLYRCEVVEVEGKLRCMLTDVTVPVEPNETADVQGNIVGTDASGDRVFFVANGKLTADASRGTCPHIDNAGQLPPASDSCGLYAYDAATQTVRLVAELSGRDFPDWGNETVENLMWLTARVSPNGRYLAFMSQRSLTGYDNRDASSGLPDEEVYRYDFTGAALTCVSCKKTGARPNGVFDTGDFPGLLVDRPKVWQGQSVAAVIPGWTSVGKSGPPVRAPYQSRYLNNDGRVFFDSSDNLVSSDTNGEFDVYEYEPAGAGSCATEAGCVSLMSSGRDRDESAFVDASETGGDVFFLSAAQLAPGDVDHGNDVYDAHVCPTGQACTASSPPPRVTCEELDSCRGAPAPQSAGLVTQTLGEGNVQPIAPPQPKPKAVTRAQHLAKALKTCKKFHGKRRKACEKTARRRYGSRQHVKVSKHRRNK